MAGVNGNGRNGRGDKPSFRRLTDAVETLTRDMDRLTRITERNVARQNESDRRHNEAMTAIAKATSAGLAQQIQTNRLLGHLIVVAEKTLAVVERTDGRMEQWLKHGGNGRSNGGKHGKQ